jgi:hypothetical protein
VSAGRVVSFTVLNCSDSVSFIPVFEVVTSFSSNSSCVGVFAFAQPAASSYDDAVALASEVGSAPRPMFVPGNCVSYSSPPNDCTWNNVNFPSPTYSQVFCQPESAENDMGYWLGMWVAFLVVFCLSAPVVAYGIVVNCRSEETSWLDG